MAVLTLNRPDRLNAVNRSMLAELRAHLEQLAVDDSVGCVVLAGAGRSFGAGHDLSETGRQDEGEWRYFERTRPWGLPADRDIRLARHAGRSASR